MNSEHSLPIVLCYYASCTSDLKCRTFCLSLNYQDTKEMMGKMMVHHNQFKSTPYWPSAKDRALCWTYMGGFFFQNSGDSCSNWTKQLFPPTSSFKAVESPAGSNWKAQLAQCCQREGSPLAVPLQQTRTYVAGSSGWEHGLVWRLQWTWLSRIKCWGNYKARKTVMFPSSYLVCTDCSTLIPQRLIRRKHKPKDKPLSILKIEFLSFPHSLHGCLQPRREH